MSEGTKKVLILAGVVGLVVLGVYFYDPTCSNELVRALNSSCFGPK